MDDVARILELRDRLPNEWAALLTRSAQALAAVQADQGDDEKRLVVILAARPRGSRRPFIVTGGPRPKRLHPGTTTAIWRKTMSEPEGTPFRHTTECKMQDAEPTWYPVGEGHYERVCVCRKEISYPPMWRRPDIFDPAVMQHGPGCEIADKPEMLKLAVKVNEESTYTFANCTVCTMNWYAWDQPPVDAGQR